MGKIALCGTGAAIATAAAILATPAFAAHVTVYGPETRVFASSSAHQGPYVQGTTRKIINGVSDPNSASTGPGGSASGGGSVANSYAQVAQPGGSGNLSFGNAASGSADLTNGLLKATTQSYGPEFFGSPAGLVQSQLQDTIFFNNASGGTVTVSLTYRFDGQLYDPYLASANGNPGGNVSLMLSCGGNQYACNNGANGTGDAIVFAKADGSAALLPNNTSVVPFDTNWNYYFTYQNTGTCFGENIYCGSYSSNLWDYGLNAPNAAGIVDGYIRAYLNIPAGLTSLGLRGVMNLSCSTGSSCDFGHTGAFGFGALPTGLTYSSASGTFLTGNVAPPTNPGGVPEPATWAMTILGFGLIGAATRSRRPAATIDRLSGC